LNDFPCTDFEMTAAARKKMAQLIRNGGPQPVKPVTNVLADPVDSQGFTDYRTSFFRDTAPALLADVRIHFREPRKQVHQTAVRAEFMCESAG
jgi:hypothetical protein